MKREQVFVAHVNLLGMNYVRGTACDDTALVGSCANARLGYFSSVVADCDEATANMTFGIKNRIQCPNGLCCTSESTIRSAH